MFLRPDQSVQLNASMSPMMENLLENFQSIRFKIAFLFFLVLTLSFGVSMFGIWTFQRDQLVNMANQEAMRGGRIIEKSLRTSMLTNDKAAIQETVNEISILYDPPSRISIIGNNFVVAVSSDPSMNGLVFDRSTEASCIVCHHQGNAAAPVTESVMIDTGKGPLLRNVIKIKNEPACHQCHPAAQVNLGVLLYDTYFSRTYALLKTVALRMLLTGLATFLVISIVLILFVNKYIHRPIQNLSDGFMHVGHGDFDFWVNENSSTEFGYMADSFNVMSKATGRFIKEIKSKTMETSILYTILQEVSETIVWERLQRIIIDLLNSVFQGEINGLVMPLAKKEDCIDIIWRRSDENRVSRVQYCLKDEKVGCPAVNREELLDWNRGNLLSHRFSEEQGKVLIPLYYNQESQGLLCVLKKAGLKFSRHERAIIPALASHVAISLTNSRLYHMAITDGLTGLYSKRYFLDKIEMLSIKHQHGVDTAWFVIMLDIDHFKQVNDTYGHPAGDQVLIQVAEIIQGHIRFEDIAFRYGGEEFTVLMPVKSTDRYQGTEIAERLRRRVENHVFVCQEGTTIPLTISLGVSHFPGNGTAADDVVRAADAALYEAKRNGRNQVKSAPV